ncbi:MAG TPA: cytochrome c-type biogenesis CcmF C-terminal domain-containing protein, partial [Gemmatimonadaceae bacterium]
GALDAAVSRESVFLLNNLFLTAFTITVLVGTLFPLVAEAIRGVKVSVGEPFFNRMTLPICAALLFLMGVGPALPWRVASRETLKKQLVPPAIAGVLALVLSIVMGVRSPYALATFAFGGFALAANVREFIDGAAARRRAHGEAPPVALGRLVAANRRRYGGYIAHLGVLTLTLGIGASSTFRTEREATLRRGETMSVGPFTVRLDEVYSREEPQRTVLAAGVTVLRDGREVGRMEPRMNFYPTSDQPVPTPSVRSRPAGDLYINLQAFAQDGSNATLRVIQEPLVPWIWVGGMIVCLGALVSLGAGRRELAPAAAKVRAVPPPRPAPIPVEEVAR